jgi:D-aminoacyl-tRNA deacylase
MRAVVQRVNRAAVMVKETQCGAIDEGLVVLLGISGTDRPADTEWLIDKVINLRIFADQQGKMNLSLQDIAGGMLIISQFTLFGDCRKGRRPGFSRAAPPEIAEPLYRQFVDGVARTGITTATGVFGAAMAVELVNDGPVTLLLDSAKTF